MEELEPQPWSSHHDMLRMVRPTVAWPNTNIVNNPRTLNVCVVVFSQ